MFLKILDLAQNINGLLYNFANNIIDFMTYNVEIVDLPVYSLLFGSFLLTYLIYKISMSVLMPS